MHFSSYIIITFEVGVSQNPRSCLVQNEIINHFISTVQSKSSSFRVCDECDAIDRSSKELSADLLSNYEYDYGELQSGRGYEMNGVLPLLEGSIVKSMAEIMER
jgi:hypothetical protein